MLPTPEQCYALWDKNEMLPNIRAHTKQVAHVAKRVALRIQEMGVPVDVDLVETGALLHDIAKTITVTGRGKNHTKLGSDIVLQEGYGKELADVVLYHGLPKFSFQLTLEQQIVNYADKRVKHDAIVSLKNRLDDIRVRYPQEDGSLDAFAPFLYEFEEKYELTSLKM
jgi:putative nucleotidyltransferase with HDIG domain